MRGFSRRPDRRTCGFPRCLRHHLVRPERVGQGAATRRVPAVHPQHAAGCVDRHRSHAAGIRERDATGLEDARLYPSCAARRLVRIAHFPAALGPAIRAHGQRVAHCVRHRADPLKRCDALGDAHRLNVPVEQETRFMSLHTQRPETLALHAGWRADPATGAIAVPIYQTTSYQFRATEHAADLFALKELGNIYTRIMNPTNDVLEKRVTALEGGAAALAVASGQAASALAIQNIARAGDNIVSSTDLYGGTWNLFAHTLRDQGIEVRFVDPLEPDNFRRATDGRTRAYYGETLPNPKLTVFPIAEVAAIGRPLGIPLIIDNTAAPILTRPFAHGAAVVVYSSTKYLGGHGNSIGGLIVDGGNFDWAAHPLRQPAFNTPDPSYHGAVWTEAVKPLGPIAYAIKARVTLLRDLGASLSPFNAFLLIQGLETLPLRIGRHCENAQAVVNYLLEC